MWSWNDEFGKVQSEAMFDGDEWVIGVGWMILWRGSEEGKQLLSVLMGWRDLRGRR